MKKHTGILAVLLFLLFPGCGPKEEGKSYEPAVRVQLTDVSAFNASFSLNTIDAESVRYGYGPESAPSMKHKLETGSTGSARLSLSLSDLRADTDYTLRLQGIGPGGEEGNVLTLEFRTVEAPSNLYSWERKREEVPFFADISLITLGQHNPNPPEWTKERFASHVLYKDREGNGHWLFDAFLCIDAYDGRRGLSLSIGNKHKSATKDSWEDLLDDWLGGEGKLLLLDSAIDEASDELGTPPAPRYVVMSLPDPIRFQNFADKNSSTTYWGQLDGRSLDFSKVQDQQAAYRWYIDRCRARFNSIGFKHLELAGFYILSEELHLPADFYKAAGQSFTSADTWNWEYKNWEQLIPFVSSYSHSCKEGLWWIPYHLAPGYKVWRQLGFDGVFMQPNHYWDTANQHPMSKTISAITHFNMGIELEFEFSMVASVMADGRMGPDHAGNPTFTKDDVPALRARLKEYFSGYKDSGKYGVLPIALYSGTDAMHQLASSEDEADIQMYHDLCQFIIGSALKK